jgi:hypothetical protein
MHTRKPWAARMRQMTGPVDYISEMLADPAWRAAVEARFWIKVDRQDPSACWPWTAALGGSGYGVFSIMKPRNVTASALALSLHHGRSGGGLLALHRCDNRPCCNPSHLFWGTQVENIADMDAKGRRRIGHRRPGLRHHSTRLTEEAVREIRASTASLVALGERFGVSGDAIHKVRKGLTWKHVT